MSDLGNAERLVLLCGQDLRHVGAWGRWLVWDGARWVIDADGGAMRLAVYTARVMLDDALDALDRANRALAASPDDDRVKRTKKAAENGYRWAVGSQNVRRLEAMLGIAKSLAGVAATHEQLDADPWVLNVANGTIDLRTGELRAHRREDLITRLAPVDYDSAAMCPIWDGFLLRAMGGDVELMAYLARVFGYALTGSIREHALGFFFGGGANGKSTALGTIHAMMGDYAAPAPRGLLFRSRGDRHPTELAALHGRRFVTCAEIEAGAAFDEALVKDLTGGDPITARRMREDFWTFAPTHKLFVAGNHKPTVRGDDEGIWRRMRLVPWAVVIPTEERDKRLPERLRAELSGILAWCVRGCLQWQAEGLGEPLAVVAATAEYRTESDTLGDFFRSCLTVATEGRITRKGLRELYEGWCTENGYDHPVGPRKLAERLKSVGAAQGSVRTPAGPRDGWHGLREATAEERATRQWTRAVVSSDLSCPDPHLSDRAGATEDTNSNSTTTSHYPTTGTDETLGEWVERQGG